MLRLTSQDGRAIPPHLVTCGPGRDAEQLGLHSGSTWFRVHRAA